ncbi:MAG: hypothetical protein HY910_15630 [Desulfarculus sp.]|nr:hypothetical protein [Desulfarculus sp.]
MMMELEQPGNDKPQSRPKISLGLARRLVARLATHLARTRYGQLVLSEDADLTALRRRPSVSLYAGLALIAVSFAMGWAALVLGGYLAMAGERTWVMAAGAVAVFVLVHIVFAAGVWLAGANYAAILLHWAARKFLLGHADRDAGPA